ncbi:D-aminoacyl-tRNA deacylase 2-like [Glandiceps talaboti]
MDKLSPNPTRASMPRARIVLQQCTSARVQVQSPAESTVDFIEISKGVVVYVCFLRDCTMELLNKMVHMVLNLRYLKGKEAERVSVLELPGDVLIVPQSTLGGMHKKRHVTYHYNINKEEACKLYQEFVRLCKHAVESNEDIPCRVRYGQYNNKCENMTVESGKYGLMTHLLEF